MKISTVEAWVNEVAKGESTKGYYRKQLEEFLEYCGCSAEDITEQWELADALVEKKLKKKWNRKIKEYKAILSANPNLVEGTVTTYLCPILSFFNWIDIPLKVKVKSGIVTYHNRDILREEVDQIVSNAPQIRDRAYFSMLAQTRLRPVVLNRLQYIDIKEDWERKVVPCKINVPKHKNKGEYKAHYTFMPLESVEHLRKYFDSRFGIGKNPNDDDLIFTRCRGNTAEPVKTESQTTIFSRIVLNLGIDKREKYGKPKAIRMYNLRKFFRNNITDSPEIDSVDCHFFMGHKLNMNDEHYFSAQNIEKFRKKFDKASEFVKIGSIPDTYKEKVKLLEAKLIQTEIELSKSLRENEELKRMIGDTEVFGEGVTVSEYLQELSAKVNRIEKHTGLGKGKRLFDEDY